MISGQRDAVAAVSNPADDDRDVGDHIVAGGKKRRAREAAACRAKGRQHSRADEIDDECSEAR